MVLIKMEEYRLMSANPKRPREFTRITDDGETINNSTVNKNNSDDIIDIPIDIPVDVLPLDIGDALSKEEDLSNGRAIIFEELKRLQSENGDSEQISLLKDELDQIDADLHALSIDLGRGIAPDGNFNLSVDLPSESESSDEPEEFDTAITSIDMTDEESAASIQMAKSLMISPDRLNSKGLDSIQGHSSLKRLMKTHIIAKERLPNLFGKESISSIMMVGPPGTGKTEIAKGVAKDANLNFFEVRGANILSRWVGKAEKQVNAVFAVALQNEPAMIFIDEADALLGLRDKDDGKSRGVTDVFLQALSDVDKLNKKIYITAATNNPENLDPAIIRRFKNVHVKLPGDAEREQIWRAKILSSGIKLSEDVDFETLSTWTHGYSGSDINTLAKEILNIPVENLVKNVSPNDYEFMTSLTQDDLEPIAMIDFERTIENSPPTVSKDTLDKLDAWWDKYK